MKYTLLFVVLAVVIAVALAEPQQRQPQQQQRLQQQQQRRRPAQGGQQGQQGQQGQRRRVQGGAGAGTRRPGGAIRRPQPGAPKPDPNKVEVVLDEDGKPLHLDPNLTLSKIAPKDLEEFMQSKFAVDKLVICFEQIRRCSTRSGVSLVRDVRSLGRGASCKDCTREEQNHKKKLVGRAISLMQQNHPEEWRRVLPHIAFLL